MIKLEYDKEADALYIRLRRRKHHHSREVDESRFIDYAANNTVIGIEVLYASGGIDTEGLPHRANIKETLQKEGFKVAY